LDEQLAIFVDILGFREAVESGHERDRLIELLRNLASLQTNSGVQETPTGVQMTGAVTTFSDHIVASYPIADLGKVWETVPLQLGMHNAKRFVATLAMETAKLGLLIAAVSPLGSSITRIASYWARR